MKTIRDVNVKNKVVLVRVDFNVPIEDGAITSDLRVRACLPTLDYLREHGAKKIILISHLGRPEGRDKTLSLKLVAELLDRLIGNVAFVSDVSGPDVESAVRKVKNGGILVLENLRFYAGEEKNSEDFICEIIDSTKAQIFVQDGFAVVHRAHASTSAIAKHLPVYAGLLLEKEITNLEKVMRRPEHPCVLSIGGAIDLVGWRIKKLWVARLLRMGIARNLGMCTWRKILTRTRKVINLMWVRWQ